MLGTETNGMYFRIPVAQGWGMWGKRWVPDLSDRVIWTLDLALDHIMNNL